MRGGPGHQNADAWRLARSANRLLRARREQPRDNCPAEQRDEVAPFPSNFCRALKRKIALRETYWTA